MLDPHEFNEIFTNRMDLDSNEYVIVRYKIKPGLNLTFDQAAALMAISGSLGTTYPLPYENLKNRLQGSAKVVEVIESGNTVSLAYPLDIVSPKHGLTQLLSVIWFMVEYNTTSAFWVDSIELPKKFTDHFNGPRFGIEGIRKALDIPHRPLLGTITKPRKGVPLKVLIQKCEESLLGGADYIIDDELVADLGEENGFHERVFTMAQMIKKVEKATKLKKWYIVNLSASPIRAIEYAKDAINAGANALLVNAFTMGFPGFEDFTRQEAISVPVLTCNMGSSILTRPSQFTGTSEAVISMISRLAGADGVYAGISGALWYSPEVLRDSYGSLIKSNFHGKKRSMAIISGGLSVANLGRNIAIMGLDLMLQAGTSILGYPKGPFAMASAMKTIIESIPNNVSEEDVDKIILEVAKKKHDVEEALAYHNYRPKNPI